MSVAQALAGGTAEPSQAALRRAVSTAYYALFHAVLRSATGQFLADGAMPHDFWVQVYRGVDHRDARDACRILLATDAPDDLKYCCESLILLQRERLGADYDPALHLTSAEAKANVARAGQAIAALERCDAAQKRAFGLHLLLRRRG